jgi:phage terminase small subunit
MARGGYRSGSGPQKGTKYRPRSAKTKTKAAKIPRKPKKDKIPEDIKTAAADENLTPLDYMLKVMNDALAENERRDRMAIAAAPFVHPRKGEGAGKKEGREDKAKAAGAGRFSAGPSPLSLVKK